MNLFFKTMGRWCILLLVLMISLHLSVVGAMDDDSEQAVAWCQKRPGFESAAIQIKKILESHHITAQIHFVVKNSDGSFLTEKANDATKWVVVVNMKDFTEACRILGTQAEKENGVVFASSSPK